MVRRNHVVRQPTQPPTVGAGFHARPASVEGRRRCTRNNGARAVPAGYDTLGGGRYRAHRINRRRKRSRRTSATSQPRRLRKARASAELGSRAELPPSVNRRRRTGDGAPYDVWESISVKPTSSVIRYKGRRGRRPLRWVRVGMFQRSREAQFYSTRYVVCRKFGLAVARRVHRPRCTVVAGQPGWVRRIR